MGIAAFRLGVAGVALQLDAAHRPIGHEFARRRQVRGEPDPVHGLELRIVGCMLEHLGVGTIGDHDPCPVGFHVFFSQ